MIGGLPRGAWLAGMKVSMTLVPPVPLLIPTGWGPAGVTFCQEPPQSLLTSIRVTCAIEASTVVRRIRSTPWNVPVSVGTLQPVLGLLSRFSRISNFEIGCAEAPDAKTVR